MPPVPHAFPDQKDDLLKLSALEQAARVRDGSITAQALVELYLTRIRTHDPKVAAFVSVIASDARREAERLDRERRRSRPLGPFHGVPTALKDLHFVRGTFTRMGSRAWRYLWSPVDDRTARILRRAGFVILGKTSTSELAMLPIVEPDIHAPTRNPWNTAHTAGGSSGGAGAAIAGGLVPIAPGSDGAGSIRIPSALCGLVGLKPSRRLVPHGFDQIDVFQMASLGPMARDIEDAAALLDVMTGRDPGGAGSFLALARQPPRRLRLGLVLEPPMGETDPAIAARVLEAADALKALGHEVIGLEPLRATLEEFLPIYQHFISRVPVPRESLLQPMTRWFREQGRSLPRGLARARFEELAARALTQLDHVDGLITPTIPVMPPKVGEFAHLPPPEMFRAVSPLGNFTAAWNITGLPALTVPWGHVDGLPIGVQLVGRLGTDAELLALGRELEAARPIGLAATSTRMAQ